MIFSLGETLENLCKVCLRMDGCVKIDVGLQELSMRSNGNESVNFAILHFSFPLYEG